MRSKLVIEGFEKLRNKTVAIIGLGGTGCNVANMLCRYPLKKVIFIDGDKVDESNLERQLLFFPEDVGKKKVVSAKERLKYFCEIEIIEDYFTSSSMIKEIDLVIDCTDNMESRNLINKSFDKWIYTGAIKNLGTVFFVTKDNFEKFFNNKTNTKCQEVGVTNSIVNLTASWAVSLAIDFLSKGKIEENMIRINLENNEVTKVSF